MKKSFLLSAILLAVLCLTACGYQYKKALERVHGIENSESEMKTNKEEILFNAYLTNNQLAKSFEIPIFIVVHNNSDNSVKIMEGDFTILMMESDIKIGQKAVGYGDEKSITVEPHAEGYLAAYFLKPSDEIEKENTRPEHLELEYRGELENVQVSINIEGLPPYFASDADQLLFEIKDNFYNDEDIDIEEPESINGFIPEKNRFKVTLYPMEKRNRGLARAYIRVENLTDEQQTFDATKVTVLDDWQEYQLGNVKDSGFNPLMHIPPHGKVDYSEFYYLRNESDQSVEEIISEINGIRYRDDQFFEVIDIYGGYEEEIPSDFSTD